MPEIVVTDAEPPLLPVVAALYGESFDEPWPLASIENLLAPPGCWALLAECTSGEVLHPAGFALARVVCDEAEVLSVGVVPAFRRQGVAQALMAALSARARGADAKSVFLEVGADNAAAERLYRKLGFVEIGRRKDYYRRANRELVDALVMKSAL